MGGGNMSLETTGVITLYYCAETSRENELKRWFISVRDTIKSRLSKESQNKIRYNELAWYYKRKENIINL